MISETVQIGIGEFKPWLEKETARFLAPLNAQGRRMLEKIKERLNEAHAACEKLADEARREMERGKAVRKAKLTEKLARHFLRQLDSVVLPKGMSFSELDQFRRDLEKAFSSIARERSIWFPRISPLFILARRRIDLEFTRVAGASTELRGFLSEDYSRAEVVEELAAKADDLIRSLDEVSVYQRRRKDVEEKARLLQEQVDIGTTELESLKKGAELGDLAETAQRIQQLRKQVEHELRHLQKPFVKFMNLTQETGVALPADELQKFFQYLEDPLAAFATEEPGYPRLKGILTRVERMMNEGKLKLKSSRIRRGQREIEEIVNKNRLGSLQQTCSREFSRYQQSRSSEETEAAQSRYVQLQRKREELVKQREAADARLGRLQDEEKQLLERVDGQRRELEQLVSEHLERRITLKL